MTKNNDTNGNLNNNLNPDGLPTAPLASENFSAQTPQNMDPVVLPSGPQGQGAGQVPGAAGTRTAEAGAETSTDAPAGSQAAPTPFIKRKWVMITAPIVAGVLLLGIGAGAGYAAGHGGEHGGGHSQIERGGFGDQGNGRGYSGDREDGGAENGGFENGRGGDRGATRGGNSTQQFGQESDGRTGSTAPDAGPRAGTDDVDDAQGPNDTNDSKTKSDSINSSDAKGSQEQAEPKGSTAQKSSTASTATA